MDSPLLAFSHGLNNAFILDGKTITLETGGIRVDLESDSPAAVVYTGGYLDRPRSYVAIEFEDIPFPETRRVTASFTRRITLNFRVL